MIRSFCRPPGIFFIVGSILGDCDDAARAFYLLITIYFIYRFLSEENEIFAISRFEYYFEKKHSDI